MTLPNLSNYKVEPREVRVTRVIANSFNSILPQLNDATKRAQRESSEIAVEAELDLEMFMKQNGIDASTLQNLPQDKQMAIASILRDYRKKLHDIEQRREMAVQNIGRAAHLHFESSLTNAMGAIRKSLQQHLLELWTMSQHTETRKPSKPRTQHRTSNRLPLQCISALKSFYNGNPHPSTQQKHELAHQTGLSYKQVSTWFINKRARDKQKQQEYMELMGLEPCDMTIDHLGKHSLNNGSHGQTNTRFIDEAERFL